MKKNLRVVLKHTLDITGKFKFALDQGFLTWAILES